MFEAAPSHTLWTQQQDPYRGYFHICSRCRQLCLLAARCATAQPRARSPSTQMRHLQDCTTVPTWDCMPKALGVWRRRQWGDAAHPGFHLICRLEMAKISTQTRFLGMGMARQTCLLKAVTRCITSHPAHAGLGQPGADLGSVPCQSAIPDAYL